MTKDMTRAPDPRTDKTRMALMQIGIKLGGQQGFEHTSVRQIADEAGVNLSAINYHFGGKEGLREAIIEEIGCHMRDRGPGFYLRELTPIQIDKMTVDEAKDMIRKVMLMGVKSGGDSSVAGEMPQFMQREIFSSGEKAAYFFDKVFKTELGMMCQLVSRVQSTDPEAPETRLRALTIIGQSVFINIARSLVCAAMDWERIGEAELSMLERSFWVDS